MTCSMVGCDKNSVIKYELMGVTFSYCLRHENYPKHILKRQTMARSFDSYREREKCNIVGIGY